MARVFRALKQGFLYLLSPKESDGENVGRGDVTDMGGATAGSADFLMTDTGNEECFSGPIHITEAGDKNKLPDAEEVAAASDAQETTEEVHNANQEQSESLSMFPKKFPSTSQKRRKRRATTVVLGSDTELETKKTRRVRGPNWTSEETKMLIACKSDPSLSKGEKGWREIAAIFRAAKTGVTRDAVQCRQRWDTLHRRGNQTLTTITSSEPAANELNGASTSTHLIGQTNLPSSACPNLEVMPAAVAPAGWNPTAEASA